MKEIITSVGIDIGTSTTQLIFSKLTIENLASSYTVPQISIVKKEVIYRSDIYFTPLVGNDSIDVKGIEEIVSNEYKKAGMTPKDLQTGAVIITGETARKENANIVLQALSGMAGDFVVATAGPDLEAVLSAKGAGANVVSEEERNTVANIDIGGGTSNIAVFRKGRLVGTSCLDIGGRLIKIENNKITYIYKKIQELCKNHNIKINVGDTVDDLVLRKLCEVMTEHIFMAVNILPRSNEHKDLYTNKGDALPADLEIDGLTFSGGVADTVYNPVNSDYFRYNDIGALFGTVVSESKEFKNEHVYEAQETIRATVVGAGTHTTEVSGSTIKYDAESLPVKNVPVMKIPKKDEEVLEQLTKYIDDNYKIYSNGDKSELVGISLSGEKYITFKTIQKLAQAIVDGLKNHGGEKVPVLIIVENDIGKVLGNAVDILLYQKRKVISIDNIFVKDGDYVDIGEPVANGRVVPVVTKTLIFNN